MIQLFDHNQAAYQSVLATLSRAGKAAVIHPTGTGKSFIAFKLAEDSPGKNVLWLSPSEKIYRTQLENLQKASGFSPQNITFLTYARLTYLPAERLPSLKPDIIVLDEFHRTGAPVWGKSVRAMLSRFPEAKLLGLSATNIRYLDGRRDMAEELFDNCIADQMSLADAVAGKILTSPEYVISLYAYQLDEEKYRSRISRASCPVRLQAEQYLDKLRRAIEKAEGLEDIFPRHMPDLHGKYIVFCSGRAHMQEMMQKSQTWFRKADEHPRLYSVWAESPTAEQDYSAFKEDASDHLRLLFCIDMFNEGIHIRDISGVILFRPTVSPILYKQQIGRALSALQPGKTTLVNNYRGINSQGDNSRPPVIFDIVNNFENIDSVVALRKEVSEVISSGNESTDQDLADISKETVGPFRIIDEVRECRELFRKLEDTLSHSWEAMYREAEAYYRRNGHLRVPKNYRTSEGARLGSWIQTQRRVKRGVVYGNLTEDKIQRLEQIGMNWTTRSETSMEAGISHAKAYAEQFGNLDVTSRYVSPDGYHLGNWISAAREKYTAIRNSKSDKNPFDIPKLKALDELGMIWNKADESFQRGLRAAKEYADRNGNLEVSFTYVTEDGFGLGKWLENLRTWMKSEKTTERAKQKYAQLNALGMRWNTKASCIWEANYQIAKAYYEANHHLNPPCNYKMGRLNLGKWIARQRELFQKGKLNQEQIAKLESIHINWISPALWNRYFALAEQYICKNGTLNIAKDYVTSDGALLGRWIHEQRHAVENGTLSQEHRRKIQTLAVDLKTQRDQTITISIADKNIRADTETKDSKTEQKTNAKPEEKTTINPETNNSEEQAHWDLMLDNLTNWITAHPGTYYLPTNTKAEDGTNLYVWTQRQYSRRVKGQLSPYQQQEWDLFLEKLYRERKQKHFSGTK